MLCTIGVLCFADTMEPGVGGGVGGGGGWVLGWGGGGWARRHVFRFPDRDFLDVVLIVRPLRQAIVALASNQQWGVEVIRDRGCFFGVGIRYGPRR